VAARLTARGKVKLTATLHFPATCLMPNSSAAIF
jgi:hypothetical protein